MTTSINDVPLWGAEGQPDEEEDEAIVVTVETDEAEVIVDIDVIVVSDELDAVEEVDRRLGVQLGELPIDEAA